MKRTLLLHISTIILLTFCVSVNAQNDSIPNPKSETKPTAVSDSLPVTTANDSTTVKIKYGLRVGGDLSKIVRSFLDDEYSGFEIMADYRLKHNLYIAGELGFEEKTSTTDYLNITSSGSYIKAGIDLNSYQNWLDMDNMIYFGFRIGASSFKHDLNSYTIYNTSQYWPQLTQNDLREYSGLTAFWAELQLGMKAELFTNLFLGLNVQLKFLASEKQPDNFENVYIPGFGKTYDSSKIGTGYSYFLSYRIPLFKKSK